MLHPWTKATPAVTRRQLWYQIWPLIRPHWYQMGQIWDFLRSIFCSFWHRKQILKVPFGVNLTHFEAKSATPGEHNVYMTSQCLHDVYIDCVNCTKWRNLVLLSRHNRINKLTSQTKLYVTSVLCELGDQICPQNGSDWPQMGQIRDFFRSDFSTFWRGANKSDLKNPWFVPFGANLTHFGTKSDIPDIILKLNNSFYSLNRSWERLLRSKTL